MFIQTEATPNPETLKFLPGKVVLANDTREYLTADDANESPLAAALFDVKGVKSVFFGYDFVTVTKSDAEWQHLKPAILGAIMEHFVSGAPLFRGEQVVQVEDEFFDSEDSETVATINDGGDITFKGFRDGIVYLTMKGACSGCPSSTATLRHGIQNLFKHFLPDVKEVQAA